MRLVLDASVAVKWYAPEDETREALEIADAAQRGQLLLVAPDILLSEFGHTLRKAVLVGLPRENARALFNVIPRMVELLPSVDFGQDALELAMLAGGSFYDALYVALSERQNLRVVTADSRMIKAFDRTGRCVHVKDFKF